LAVVDVVDGLALDDPAAGGLTVVELTVRGFMVAELDGSGFASLEVDAMFRETSSPFVVIGLRDVAAAETVVEGVGVAADSLAFVEVEAIVRRTGGTGSVSFAADIVLDVGRRAVVVVAAEVEAVGALTVVRVVVTGVAFLMVVSVSFALPFPAAVIVLVLFTAFVCGSGSETFKTRSISFASISSSSPFSAAGFLVFVTAVLVVVRVGRLGPGSSALDAERVARRVGIFSQQAIYKISSTWSGGLNEKKSRGGTWSDASDDGNDVAIQCHVPEEGDKRGLRFRFQHEPV
jgi:hypothetical protein